nr:hypothetical protein [Allomuricauda sp.]
MRITTTLFSILGLLMLSISTYGQNQNVDSLYSWFDKKTGVLNSGLYESHEFVEEYQVINDKHRFFDSQNYSVGSIWYKGQPFYDVLMKYDLFKDQVVISPRGISAASAIILDNAHIDSFSIGGRKFIKMEVKDIQSKPLQGFYEAMDKSDDWSFLKKHRKVDVRKLNRNRVYYEFKEKNEFVLEYNQQYFLVKSRNDLLDVFPLSKDAKRSINSRNSARILTDASAINLLREINVLLSDMKTGDGL